MKNIEMTINGDIVTIKVDLSKTFGKSSSGPHIYEKSRGSGSCPGLLQRCHFK